MRPSDSIADLLTRIRNASHAQQRYVDIAKSKIKLELVKILHQQGFISNYLVREDSKQGVVRVFLKYETNRQPVIQGLKRVSKPSVRHYVGYSDIPYVLGGLGISILSTSKGLMTGKEAKEQKLGGEVLCFVW